MDKESSGKMRSLGKLCQRGVSSHLSSAYCKENEAAGAAVICQQVPSVQFFSTPRHRPPASDHRPLRDSRTPARLPQPADMAKSSSRKSLKSLFSKSEASLAAPAQRDADKNEGEKKRFKFLKFKIKSKNSSGSEKPASENRQLHRYSPHNEPLFVPARVFK